MSPRNLTIVVMSCCVAAVGLRQAAADETPLTMAGFTGKGQKQQRRIEARFLKIPRAEDYRRHLERLTRDPHPSGSAANYALADYLADVMSQAGLTVDRHEYDAWMPHHKPNSRVALVRPVRLPLNDQEYILPEDPFSAHPDLTPGWNAYAATGDVTGEVVYVNYGRREDYQTLKDRGVQLEGRIAIARYGGNYRGFKVKYAEEAGAIGVIIYSDPANYGYRGGPVYPEGKQWSESTVQRGSVKTLPYPGDPLTPFVPALPMSSGGVERLAENDVALPRIPVTPLPYGSAQEILSRMQGDAVPSGWQGGLPFAYRLTGGVELTVRVQVEQPRQLVRVVNVCGTVDGTDWPEQEILLGSHYDAWSFGAADPNGGTAMLLTLADALGELAQRHPPKRSITICHWDAEEYGIIGSTEFVEEHRDRLAHAVAYVNADMAVTGPRPAGSASPTLKQLLVQASAAVEHPDGDGDSVLSQWLAATGKDEPAVGNLGGGSDHVGFYTHLGIPSMWPGLGGPSLYHSGYDDLAFYERFCDPDFTYGPTLSRWNGLIALRLANADLLPYEVDRYAVDLQKHVQDLRDLADKHNVQGDWSELDSTIESLSQATAAYDQVAGTYLAGTVDTRQLADINDHLITLERSFLLGAGLQGRPWSRSLYAAPDPFSGYASWMLPGLRYEILEGDSDSLTPWLSTYASAVTELTKRVAALTTSLSGS